jgi:lysophospholipase L1-like esterase
MKNEKILFIGSSIIKQWKTDYFFPNSINLGESGLTSDQLLEKIELKSELFKNITKKYRNIVLYIGGNDIINTNNTCQEIYNNITKIIFLLQKYHNINKIIVISILKSPDRTKLQNKKIDFINWKIKEFTQMSNQNNILFYNPNYELSYTDNYLPDKIHLSEKGYYILSQKIQFFFNLY